jgi:hypothetical protein
MWGKRKFPHPEKDADSPQVSAGNMCILAGDREFPAFGAGYHRDLAPESGLSGLPDGAEGSEFGLFAKPAGDFRAIR